MVLRASLQSKYMDYKETYYRIKWALLQKENTELVALINRWSTVVKIGRTEDSKHKNRVRT